jgi:DNA-binding GntR family transcriptional regulator
VGKDDSGTGTGGKQRHTILREVLLDRIEAGTYPVGSFLPTEAELCTEFGVSRYTVREALRRLTDSGHVRRRQGSGSEVISKRPVEHYVHSMRSLEGLFQYAADTTFSIEQMGLAVPGPDHADDLPGGCDAPWLVLRGMRSDAPAGLPICATLVFVNAAYQSLQDELPGGGGAIYRKLEDRFGVKVAEVEQEFRVVPMPPEAGRALGTRRGAWAVRVLRRYRAADGQLLLASVNFHPADRFFYSMRMQREPGRGWT